MAEDKNKDNQEVVENPADNIAGDTTNEQVVNDNTEENVSESDSVAVELAALKDSHLRLMAEYDNYRKRTLKEKTELIKNGGEKTLIGLLPVLDDFERALKNISPESNGNALFEGVTLIYNKFISFLNQNGVKAIEALHKPFDDELFDAIATIPAPSEELKGKVIDCVQTGYMLNDKVIRHAKVVVAE